MGHHLEPGTHDPRAIHEQQITQMLVLLQIRRIGRKWRVDVSDSVVELVPHEHLLYVWLGNHRYRVLENILWLFHSH